MSEKIALEESLDLKKLATTGSVIAINQDYYVEAEEVLTTESKNVDFLGKPVQSIEELLKDPKLINVDDHGNVKKIIIEHGGGVELDDRCTVSVAYSGYFEKDLEPFDVRSTHKPLVVDLKENGLLPGLLTAIKSMLVGELSMFLFSYKVMYGEYGIPPRIKPKASCVFYIKLVRSVLTSKHGALNFEEENVFQRVLREARLLYTSGMDVNSTGNTNTAIYLFKKAVNMLHKCRLADEAEEKIQEKLLIKLYINLAICYNKMKRPLQACTACNELNRLKNIWNDSKILFQNAKALRMIGAYNEALKRINRALKLSPNNKLVIAELELLNKVQAANEMRRNKASKVAGSIGVLVSDDFKKEVDGLLKSFKVDPEVNKLSLPAGLGPAENDYIKEACLRENLFCDVVDDVISVDRMEEATVAMKEEDPLEGIIR